MTSCWGGHHYINWCIDVSCHSQSFCNISKINCSWVASHQDTNIRSVHALPSCSTWHIASASACSQLCRRDFQSKVSCFLHWEVLPKSLCSLPIKSNNVERHLLVLPPYFFAWDHTHFVLTTPHSEFCANAQERGIKLGAWCSALNCSRAAFGLSPSQQDAGPHQIQLQLRCLLMVCSAPRLDSLASTGSLAPSHSPMADPPHALALLELPKDGSQVAAGCPTPRLSPCSMPCSQHSDHNPHLSILQPASLP